MIHGPRMQISLSMLSQTGGHGDSWYPLGEAVDAASGPPYSTMAMKRLERSASHHSRIRHCLQSVDSRGGNMSRLANLPTGFRFDITARSVWLTGWRRWDMSNDGNRPKIVARYTFS